MTDIAAPRVMHMLHVAEGQGNRTNFITAKRMILGLVLKYMQESVFT